jgi:O-succinylbenzoate synthase
MLIDRIELHHIAMPLVSPFRTSFGVTTERPCILVAVHADGLTGWGECVAEDGPFYSAETIATAWHILSRFLIPVVIGQEIADPADLVRRIAPVRGHPIAKAALENAFWDLAAQKAGLSLAALLGAVRDRVPVGVSIGIQPSIEALVEAVQGYVAQGYRRIKLKIEPGWVTEPIGRIRTLFPDIALMADANSAFTLADAPLLQTLDQFNLLMIEQPLGYDDIADHARLQRQLRTPICLDESIKSPADMQAAVDLQACRVLNMKVGRVGGLTNALRIHALCTEAGIPMWCGGMLETGVGRAVNLALAGLPNFRLPGDISATDRYYHEDIADPPFVLNREDSTISVPDRPGIGVTVDQERVARSRKELAVTTRRSQ